MDLQSVLKDCAITTSIDYTAAAQATVNGTGVDMTGYENVCFIAVLGAITSTGTFTMHAEQGADNSADWEDLIGTSIAGDSDDDDKVLIMDIKKPKDRYVRPVVITATANGAISSVIAIKYNGKKRPVVQDTDFVIDGELHASPAEGTI